MDIARGSRRARHVAANGGPAAGSQADDGAGAAGQGGRHRLQRPHQQLGQQHHHRHQPQEQEQEQEQEQHHRENEPPQLHNRHQQQQHQPQHQPQRPPQVTPNNNNTHRTPDQQPVNHNSSSSVAAPPPHPFRLHRSTRPAAHPRLSMPLDSDDSSSEPDLSMLGMTRGGNGGVEQPASGQEYGEMDDWYEQPYEPGDTSIEEQTEEQEEEVAPLFDPTTVGLKEISNLGKFTVSSHKQGNGVEELRSDDLKLYWQSDGPQPHRLTVYFVKRVGIRDIRFFVDYTEDESYTPTKIVFKSGTSENNLIEFASMNLDSPVGWQQVPIAGAGGDPDGNTLVSYVLQMQILDNHQNGKDTHLRGIKIYAFDADAAQGAGGEATGVDCSADLEGDNGDTPGDKLSEMARTLAAATLEPGDSAFTIPDFMREPEIR